MAEHTDFTMAFQTGRKFELRPEEMATLRARKAGNLVLPSGQIVVCDPSVSLHNMPPLSLAVPEGRYQMVLSVARTEDGEDTVGCAKLILRDKPVTKWQLASRSGPDPRSSDGDNTTFSVETGFVCIADLVTTRKLTEDEHYASKMRPDGVAWIKQVRSVNANLVAFPSGSGDGRFQSYWGLAKDGRPACLVVDFNLFELEGSQDARHVIEIENVAGIRKGTRVEHEILGKMGLSLDIVDSLRHRIPDRKRVLAFVISGENPGAPLDAMEFDLMDSAGKSMEPMVDIQDDRASMGTRRVYTLELEDPLPRDARLSIAFMADL